MVLIPQQLSFYPPDKSSFSFNNEAVESKVNNYISGYTGVPPLTKIRQIQGSTKAMHVIEKTDLVLQRIEVEAVSGELKAAVFKTISHGESREVYKSFPYQ